MEILGKLKRIKDIIIEDIDTVKIKKDLNTQYNAAKEFATSSLDKTEAFIADASKDVVNTFKKDTK